MALKECTYTCTATCPYFPNVETNNWVYDEKEPYIKRRATPVEFMCGYDGHKITSWTKNVCPRHFSEIKKFNVRKD